MALTAQIARNLERGGSVALPAQGADTRLRVRPVSPEAIATHDWVVLSLAGAQWVAFEMSIWHEIATWYGYASLAEWPEKISAFSPEDLYSNLLGTKLAAGIVRHRGARSDQEYDRNMDAWIAAALERLQALPIDVGKSAMRSVDGLWWDSHKRIPEWDLVLRRNSQIEGDLRPWLVSDATGWNPAAFRECRDAGSPLALRHSEGFEGTPFRDHLTLEYTVHDALVAQGFPLRDDGSRVVTQEDFPRIVAAIRAANAAALGEGANRP